MNQRVPGLIAVLAAAAALAAPAAAQSPPGQEKQSCTAHGSLPPGPPPRVGQITVVSTTGHVTTPPLVPGPCSAPGWLKNHPPAR